MLPCPICGKEADRVLAPFCSRRCADIDLGRWFTGRYIVPGEPADPPAAPRTPNEDS